MAGSLARTGSTGVTGNGMGGETTCAFRLGWVLRTVLFAATVVVLRGVVLR